MSTGSVYIHLGLHERQWTYNMIVERGRLLMNGIHGGLPLFCIIPQMVRAETAGRKIWENHYSEIDFVQWINI